MGCREFLMSSSTRLPTGLVAVLPATAVRYRDAFRLFVRFCVVHFSVDVRVTRLPSTDLDTLFEFFINTGYRRFQGERRQLFVNALQGVFQKLFYLL